jgi:hypothetical protein
VSSPPTLRYEEPEICAFLDEPFEANALEEERPDNRRWPVDPHLWGAIVPRTKEWRDHISTEEAAMVQYLTGSARV